MVLLQSNAIGSRYGKGQSGKGQLSAADMVRGLRADRTKILQGNRKQPEERPVYSSFATAAQGKQTNSMSAGSSTATNRVTKYMDPVYQQQVLSAACPMLADIGRKTGWEVLCKLLRVQISQIGEMVVHEGELVGGMYVVLSGEFQAVKEDGNNKDSPDCSEATAVIEPGQVFGRFSSLSNIRSDFSVKANRKSMSLFLPKSRLLSILHRRTADDREAIFFSIEYEKDGDMIQKRKRNPKDDGYQRPSIDLADNAKVDDNVFSMDAFAKCFGKEHDVNGSVLIVRDPKNWIDSRVQVVENAMCTLAKKNAARRARTKATIMKYVVEESEKHEQQNRSRCLKEPRSISSHETHFGRVIKHEKSKYASKNDKGVTILSSKRRQSCRSGPADKFK